MATQKKVAAKKAAPKKAGAKKVETKAAPSNNAGLTEAQKVSDVIQHKAV